MAQKIRITLSQAVDRILADRYPAQGQPVPRESPEPPRLDFAPAA